MADATVRNFATFAEAMVPHLQQLAQGENPIQSAGLFAVFGDGRLFCADYAEEGVKAHVHLPFLNWVCQQLADEAPDPEQAALLQTASDALAKVANLQAEAARAQQNLH